MQCNFTLEDSFYGTVTVGERGQIVIPAEARKDLGINPGDKILVIKHPTARAIGLFKIGEVSKMLKVMLQDIAELESKATDDSTEPPKE